MLQGLEALRAFKTLVVQRKFSKTCFKTNFEKKITNFFEKPRRRNFFVFFGNFRNVEFFKKKFCFLDENFSKLVSKRVLEKTSTEFLTNWWQGLKVLASPNFEFPKLNFEKTPKKKMKVFLLCGAELRHRWLPSVRTNTRRRSQPSGPNSSRTRALATQETPRLRPLWCWVRESSHRARATR